jgi:chaperonin GroEL
MTGQIEDFFNSGVIDPVKVTISALENATSVASTLITTNHAIVKV